MSAEDLQKNIGYEFRNADKLRDALTHPSRQMGAKRASEYERLEFLGDRVLSLVIAEWLFEAFPTESEGHLAKRHAALVNRDILASIAETIQLEQALMLVNAEDLRRGRINVLSDALEALIGAMYGDAGSLEPARAFIRSRWLSYVNDATEVPQDAKSSLQEWAQARGLPLPLYEQVAASGPAHAPRYTIRVSVNGFAPEEAEGASKRDGEKKAAALMLEKVKLHEQR